MYKDLRLFLFRLDPEVAHHFTCWSLKVVANLPLAKSFLRCWFDSSDAKLEKTVAGLKFRNPVGLAAGFDKDAKLFNEFSTLGFGFIEVGTVTPFAQTGNEKPRLFRLSKDQALVNRMGFNNDG